MAAVKAGDRVSIVTREVTLDDDKTGLYRSYFGGLAGTVDRVYEDGSVCVDVDVESLPAEVRDRHLAMQESERKRWLENLPGEVRSRLTAEQRQLTMSYRILVSKKDIEPLKGGTTRRTAAPKDEAAEAGANSEPAEHKGPARAPEPMASSAARASAAAEPAGETEEEAARRISEAELNAAEEQYLRSLRKER
mgnify:CR=1 FL=1